jgi:ArsR family transcriptional regulator, arsenate/arsenite/antimonite-responsive transcriptional repressor
LRDPLLVEIEVLLSNRLSDCYPRGALSLDSHRFHISRNVVDTHVARSYFDQSRNEVPMRTDEAVAALSALAQEHRLALFRLLVQAGEEGMPAGAIAQALGVPNSSLSFHLAQLSRAGLIEQRRASRSIIYRANYAGMNSLIGFLMENCCGGVGCAPGAVTAEPEKEMV